MGRKRRGRGEGAVYERNGRWCATVTIGYDDQGRRRRPTILQSVFESLRLLLSEFTLPGILSEIQGWLTTGVSRFTQLLAATRANVGRHGADRGEGNHRIVRTTGRVSGSHGNAESYSAIHLLHRPEDEPHESCGSEGVSIREQPDRCNGRAWVGINGVTGDIPPASSNDPVIGVRASAPEFTGVQRRPRCVVHQSLWASTGVQFRDWLQFGCKRAAGSNGR
jgi:hypothetical protein